MIAVIQRVNQASVSVEGSSVAKTGPGLLVLLGVEDSDTEADISYVADKTVNLRIFADEAGKMNRSLLDTGCEMLVVSQFTLLGDCRKGRRPSFVRAAGPKKAESFYMKFVDLVRQKGVRAETGRFQAMMEVSLVNHGPVTLIVESRPGS
ncbi:MAG: D-aminoacyl-tRNA deacylase [Desulfosalsimonas sp.]